ncbi:MAG: RNA polymerase sigma factor, partial [Acidobacteriota bacterium]
MEKTEKQGNSELPKKETSQDYETLLFNDFLNGNDTAFKKLVELFEKPLYIYCYRIIGDEAEAADTMQM